jgi:hypothetical protein
MDFLNRFLNCNPDDVRPGQMPLLTDKGENGISGSLQNRLVLFTVSNYFSKQMPSCQNREKEQLR